MSPLAFSLHRLLAPLLAAVREESRVRQLLLSVQSLSCQYKASPVSTKPLHSKSHAVPSCGDARQEGAARTQAGLQGLGCLAPRRCVDLPWCPRTNPQLLGKQPHSLVCALGKAKAKRVNSNRKFGVEPRRQSDGKLCHPSGNSCSRIGATL